MMGYDGMDWSNGWWIVMWLFMALFWMSVIVFAAWLFTSLRGTGGDATKATPEDTLAHRLAAGEIDEPTYLRLRDEIRGRHGPLSPAP